MNDSYTEDLLSSGMDKFGKGLDTMKMVNSTNENLLNTERLLKSSIDELIEKSFVDHADDHDRELRYDKNDSFNNTDEIKEEEEDKLNDEIQKLGELKIQVPKLNQSLPVDRGFENRQINYMMERLYNVIQVYLLRNKFSLTFLKRFKCYINYLIEFNMDPMLDENVMILQDEFLNKNNFQYNNKFETILKRFLFEPNSLILNLVVYQFNEQDRLIKTYFLNWKIHLTNMKLLHMYEIFIKSKYLKIWNNNWHNYVENLRKKSIVADNLRVKEFALDAILNKYDSRLKLEALANTKFKQTIFQKMKRKQNGINENILIFIKRQTNLLKKKYWKLILLNYKLKTLKFQCTQFKQKYFLKIQKNYQYNSDLLEKALLSQQLFTLRPFLNKWIYQLEYKQTLNEKLFYLEIRFVLKKFLETWRKSYQLKSQENLLYYQLDLISCKNIFNNIWRKRFQERLHLYSLLNIKDEKLRHKFFKFILYQYQIISQSDTFYQKNLVQKTWVLWKLKSKMKQRIKKHELTLKMQTFDQWRKNYQFERKLDQHMKEKLIKTRLNKWIIQTHQRAKSMQLIETKYNKKTKQELFQLWVKKTIDLEYLQQYGDKFLRRKTVKLIQNKSHRIMKLNSVYVKELKHFNQTVQRQILVNWFEKYLKSKRIKLNKRLKYYENNHINNVQSKYLQIWMDKQELIRIDCNHIAIQYNQNQIKTKLFLTLLNKYNAVQMEQNYVDVIYHDTLTRKMLQNWKFKKDTIVQWQLDTLDQYESKLLTSMLNKWSMSHLKIKRNERTVVMFRQRWDRANLRGILNLWHDKINVSNQEFLNNIIPRSSLFTPKRDTVSVNGLSSSILKSNARESGKLPTLSGSVRLRKQQMQEMRNQYNSSRLIPSPIKDSKIFDSTTKRQLNTYGDDNDNSTNYNTRSMNRVSPIKLNFGNLQRLPPMVNNNSSTTLNGSPIKRPLL